MIEILQNEEKKEKEKKTIASCTHQREDCVTIFDAS